MIETAFMTLSGPDLFKDGAARRLVSEQICTIINRIARKGRCIVIWERGKLLFCSMDSRNAPRYLAKPTCLGVYDEDVTFSELQGDLKAVLLNPEAA